MRVSERYALEVGQAELDFVDVDITNDVPVFIDPTAIRVQSGEWIADCQELLTSYFQELLIAISEGDRLRIQELIKSLGAEPNETHLGVSREESRGRGLGPKRRAEIVDALSASKAAATGLLSDLEDAALFIPGIGRDFVSDMTTSIIRRPLVEYTQAMCAFHNIPMTPQWSGHMWNKDTLEWEGAMVDLPRGDDDKLLLVPRSIVRAQLASTTGKYYRGFLRPLLEQEEIDASSSLVRVLKNGRVKVDAKDLDKKYGSTKPEVEEQTHRHPTALKRFRSSFNSTTYPPYPAEELSDRVEAERTDYAELTEPLTAISSGRPGASAYHKVVAGILNAVFDGALANSRIEAGIHEGRKRIDILYDNVAGRGFFHWLGLHNPAATIVVECKNYAGDPANPELDQLLGRFSDRRGRVGILACRSFENRELFEQRCRDAAADGNGYILTLDDTDLHYLAQSASTEPLHRRLEFPLLRERFGRLL